MVQKSFPNKGNKVLNGDTKISPWNKNATINAIRPWIKAISGVEQKKF